MVESEVDVAAQVGKRSLLRHFYPPLGGVKIRLYNLSFRKYAR